MLYSHVLDAEAVDFGHAELTHLSLSIVSSAAKQTQLLRGATLWTTAGAMQGANKIGSFASCS